MLKLFTTIREQLWEKNHDKPRRLNVVVESPHKLYILKEAEEQFKCTNLQHGITNKESVEGQTDRGGCCTNTNNEGINLQN